MKISYNWLNEYLPEEIEKGKLSEILTSIGLEVESLDVYENIKGSLKGLIVGEVITCQQHQNADKLKVTQVNIGKTELLQIVCGAPNVAVAQKVIVAPVGTTIFPINRLPVTMKVAKIRGVESFGMICAEDEIGLSNNHSGIYILPYDAIPGNAAATYFNIYTDWIYEIGLTPNRMDAMSHIGVAKDVCAWLSHHNNKIIKPKFISSDLEIENTQNKFEVIIENSKDCKRYSGLYISNVIITESPAWLCNFLTATGQRPINNIVDITNFVLHETGQPLHAFDADILTTKRITIKNLPEGTNFKTLDEVERKLNEKDLMICNNDEPVCIAGVFGGAGSSVTTETTNIFLESAWFNPSSIRQTSLRFGLRTEAAIRFEKGVDISGTVTALKRAALLIKEISGGVIKGELIDIYPAATEKKIITLKYNYLKKLSGKDYEPAAVKNILIALDFEILNDNSDALTVAAPLSKPDIALPADIVEEIIRIDGIDNIAFSKSVIITPSAQRNAINEQLKEKVSQLLTGLGFNELVINSISNSKFYSEEKLFNSVKLLNNISADLDIMRPSMLETGLEVLAYNINRKNNNLRFFEFGKTYYKNDKNYIEVEKLCGWITAKTETQTWKQKVALPDYFTAKGLIKNLLAAINISAAFLEVEENQDGVQQKILANNIELGTICKIDARLLGKFNIKQDVVFFELNYKNLLSANAKQGIYFKEIAQYPSVERDLALIIDKKIKYADIEQQLNQLAIPFLQHYFLFDIFESDKIGADKKSLAINFTFLDRDKTLTDADVNAAMEKIIKKLELGLNAEIRK